MKIKSEVGGFLGMCTSVCNTQIFFDKNQYYLGEEARVRIVCDNSGCKKDVRRFMFKLLRVFKGHEVHESPGFHFATAGSNYLKTEEAEGIPKGENCDRTFTL